MERIVSKKSGLPRFVSLARHRDGSPRYLFRPGGARRGEATITLPGPLGSDTFWKAYSLALQGKRFSAASKTAAASACRVVSGSFGEAGERYFKSAAFIVADELTQSDKRGVLNSVRAEPMLADAPDGLKFETCPMKSLGRKHVAVLRDRKAGKPFAANKRVTYLSHLFKWAMDAELIAANPAEDVSKVRKPKGGFHAWTVDEIRAFEAKHPVGTTARLALALLGYAGLRRSDACLAGRQHLRTIDGESWLIMPQRKNRKRQGKTIEVPVLPELAQAIAAANTGDLTFLKSAYGKSYSIKGFGDRMKKWCVDAGLPHCSAHGVRKAAATIALDNGASEAQMMAIFGWEDAKEILTYTRQRDRRRLAKEGIDLLKPTAQTRNNFVTQDADSQNRVTKSG